MRNVSKLVSLMVLFCFILNTTLVFAQPETVKEFAPLSAELKPLKSEALKADALSREFSKLLKVDNEIKALDAHLTSKGFVAQKGAKNFWGVRETYQQEGKKVVYIVRIQDYTKRGSKDVAAIGQVTVTAGDRSETYSFYLDAPEGNFEKAIEYRIDKKLKILQANSWWSCVKNYLKKKCIAVCVGALVSCSGTWAAYLGCVAAACGGCFVAASACCGCDCSWWCKWAAGCCDR